MKTLGVLLVACLVTLTLLACYVVGRTAVPYPQRVVIDPRCLAAEDSAGHLRLLIYSDEQVVYSCDRGGY